MPVPEIIMLICLPVLLALCGFFSGSETALFSLTPLQRKRFAESSNIVDQTITRLVADTRRLLLTVLLANMIVAVLYINIAALLLLRWDRQGDLNGAVATALNLIPLVALIVFGEVLPKLIAARLSAAWSRVVALPLWAVHRLLSPVRIASSLLVVTPLSRLIAPKQAPAAVSAAEMESLLALSETHGVIDSQEEDLLQQVLELGQLKARDLMTPRVDIQGFDVRSSPDDLMALIRRTRLRHLPVYDKQLDHIVGMVFARQALVHPPRTRREMRKLVRPVRFVPEQQRADRLLVELRKTGTTVAIVVDEYGGTGGLITIEDIAEHLVGDIPGAYETANAPAVQNLGPGQWRVSADLSVREWANVFDGVQGQVSPAVNTLGGLIMAQLGRLPKSGERVVIGNLAFTVEKIQGRRLQTILIDVIDDPHTDSASPSGQEVL